MNTATLPGGAQHLADRRLQPLMGIGDHQLHAFQATPHEAAQELNPEDLRLRLPKPEAEDLAPPILIDAGGDYRGDRHDAAALADLQVGGLQRYGQSPSSGRSRKDCTRSSISWHNAETWDLEMPVMPSAWTRSSTLRVETP